nr:ATP-binding cassette domain-containing protein [Candidatus Synchoanobacter obligatus]
MVNFEQVGLTINGRKLLSDIEFSMSKGEHVGVIGPSGAGKSTFLNLLLGFLSPTEGRVSLFEEDLSQVEVASLEDLRMNMGMLFQTNALFAEWSVYENIAFPIRYHYGLSEEIISNMVAMKLDSVGLRGAEKLMPSELSGGMARRVSLARAVALDPKFLVYDEPFTGQDPVTKSNLKELMMKLHRQYHVSSLIVSHDIQDLSEIVDRMIVIWSGRIVAAGTVSEVMNSSDKKVQDFIQGKLEMEQVQEKGDLLTDLIGGPHV